MDDPIFYPATIEEMFANISDEELLIEVARRMTTNIDFYEKTCTSNALQEAINEAERHMQIAA